jgi:hypothetical protein
MNRQRLAFATLLVVGLAILGTAGRAADEKDEKTEDRPAAETFAGKIMLVHMDFEMEILAQVMTDVEFKEIKGRTFLVGLGADTKRSDDWRKGKKIYVAWDKVTGYMLLTKDEFDKYLDIAGEDQPTT